MPNFGKKRDTGCPIAYGLDTFGDRWSLIVLRDIMMLGKQTYGEFLASDEGIATNVLADRLKQLEAEGIIKKNRDPDNRRRFLYTPTDKGLDLAPVILEMARWAGDHDPNTKVGKQVADRIKNDRDGLIAEIRDHFKKG